MDRLSVAQFAASHSPNRTRVIVGSGVRNSRLVRDSSLRSFRPLAIKGSGATAAAWTEHVFWLKSGSESENTQHCCDGAKAHRNQHANVNKRSTIEVFGFHRVILQEAGRLSGEGVWGFY